MQEQNVSEIYFSTSLPIILLVRPTGDAKTEWKKIDQGMGMHTIPASGYDLSIRVHNIDDKDLALLIEEISSLSSLTELNLSENRKITDDGLKNLKLLPGLTSINLSSCGITGRGLDYLAALTHLERLDLSFCNRITDQGLRSIRNLSNLSFLNLQGCVKISNAGLVFMNRKGLTIYRR